MLLPLSLLLDTLNNFVTFFVPPLRDTRNFTNKTLLCHCHSPFPFSHCCLLPPLFPFSLSPFCLLTILPLCGPLLCLVEAFRKQNKPFGNVFIFILIFLFVCCKESNRDRGVGGQGRREGESTKAAKNGYYCYALLPKISPGLGK